MTHNSSNKGGMKDFYKTIGKLISSFIIFVTLVIGFVNLIKGNTGLATIILLCIGISGLWIGSFYIYFKKKYITRLIQSDEKYHKDYIYSKNARIIALIIIILFPLLTVGCFLGWKYWQSLPSDKIIILLADFDGPNKNKYRVTGNIKDQLEKATKKYPDVKIELFDETITYEQESDHAHEIGEKRKASIVLWGEYTVNEENVQIIAHFGVLRKPKGLELQYEVEELNVEVSELRNFTIQEQLSSEMTYLVLLTLGLARYEAGDYTGAINIFTDAINEKSVPEEMIEPAVIYFYRGNSYANIGDFNSTLNDYTQAIEIDPNLAEAYNNRGITYKNKGDADSAMKDYNKAIKTDPNHAGTYNNRGNIYYYRDDFDSAIKDYNKAIELEHDFAYAYSNRGNLYKKKGDYKSAINDFNQAINIDPRYSNAYNNRGCAYGDIGDLDSAIKEFNKAIKFNPQFAYAYNNRGITYHNKGEFNHAIKDFNEAIELNSQYSKAYYYRGVCHLKVGNNNLAIADLQKVLTLKNNPELEKKALLELEKINPK